jgi:multisubunit Na+/H+ antiporter MnhG subunit
MESVELSERFPGLMKIGLRVFLALVALNAAVGVAAILGADLDGNGGRVYLTSLVVTGGVMFALACSLGHRVRDLGPAWLLGLAATAIGTITLIVGIWTDPAGDAIWQVAGTCWVIATAVALATLLGLCALPDRYRWMHLAAYAIGGLLAALAIVAIWSSTTADSYWRLFAILCVLGAALAVTIPVVSRASRRERVIAASANGASRFCPFCGRPHDTALDVATVCPSCDSQFSVHRSITETRGVSPTSSSPSRPGPRR